MLMSQILRDPPRPPRDVNRDVHPSQHRLPGRRQAFYPPQDAQDYL